MMRLRPVFRKEARINATVVYKNEWTRRWPCPSRRFTLRE
jgi:hypothetical protein